MINPYTSGTGVSCQESDTVQLTENPQDVNVSSGNSLKLNCTYSAASNIDPAWIINGSIHSHPEGLPLEYSYNGSSRILQLNSADCQRDGTTIQCVVNTQTSGIITVHVTGWSMYALYLEIGGGVGDRSSPMSCSVHSLSPHMTV